MIPTVLALTLTLLSSFSVRAQGDLSSKNNLTDLEGTWSSGSGAVKTGGAFCTPAEDIFTYPNNTGISYSFTNTGFFEEAQYRYTANASNPACIEAVIFWQHGTYNLNNNGSITLYPFSSDGRIQVQNPCAAVTNIITYYNQITLYSDWGIIVDIDSGNYVLNLNKFDGAKMPPMYLVAKPPNMLPTQILTGVNASGQTVTRKRSTMDLFKRSAASPRLSLSVNSIAAGVLGITAIGLGGAMLL